MPRRNLSKSVRRREAVRQRQRERDLEKLLRELCEEGTVSNKEADK